MQKRRLILHFIYLTILFYSCTQSDKVNENAIFRYNEYRNVTSLDPAFARNPQNIWPINQLFNGLVQLDKNLTIQPEIAKAWTISPDGLTYQFSLRKDVFFHSSPLFGENQTRAVVASDLV